MGYNHWKKKIIRMVIIFFPILVGIIFFAPDTKAFEIHSENVENFRPNMQYSYFLNLSESQFVLYSIRTENSPFEIEISKKNNSEIENSQTSVPNVISKNYFFRGFLPLYSLSEELTEYNLTITNVGTQSDFLSFNITIYNKTPEIIEEISVDNNINLSQNLNLVFLIIPCVSILISRKISKIHPPSKRRKSLKKFGITIIVVFTFLFLSEIFVYLSANHQNINSDYFENHFEKSNRISNYPFFNNNYVTIVFEWSETYKSDELGIFYKNIELINSNDDNYSFTITHEHLTPTNTEIIVFMRFTIPIGDYIIIGGKDLNFFEANPISELKLTPISLLIFSLGNLILGLTLFYHIFMFRFKRKVNK